MKTRKSIRSILLALLLVLTLLPAAAFAEEPANPASPASPDAPVADPATPAVPVDAVDEADCALGITYLVINNKGEDITASVNGLPTPVQTTKTRVMAMTDADYHSRIWFDGAGCVSYNSEAYTGEHWMTSIYEMTASNDPNSSSLLFGKEYDMPELLPGGFVEGQYYTLQGFTYEEAPYSWEVQGADEYVEYGASVYFRYKKGMKLTCRYLMDESENTSLSANVRTVTDWKGNVYRDYGHVPTDDEIAYDCGETYAETYGLVNQVQYKIFNEAGELMHFREECGRFYYDPSAGGDVSLKNVRGISHLYGMPDGTYTIREMPTTDYTFEDQKVRTFTVRNGAEAETVRMINTCNLGTMTLYQYYADENSPKPVVSYFIRLGAENKEDVWFEDLGYDEEGTRHYRFTGLVTNEEQPGLVRKVEATGKTVIDHLPMGMIYTIIEEDYFAGYFGNGEYESYSLHTFFPEIIRQNVFDNTYGIREIFKTDSLTGEPTDAAFTASLFSDSEDWLYEFKHHDKLEFNGKVYENVYEVVGITELAGKSESNDIRTVDGHACIFYPEHFNLTYSKRWVAAYRAYRFDIHASYMNLSEKEAEEGYEIFDGTISTSDLYDLRIDSSKQEYSNTDVQFFQPMVFETVWKTDPTAPINLENVRYPSVTKSVENGTGGTYDFSLFEQGESGDWTRILDFKVKEGETVFLKPEQTNEDGSITGYLKDGKTYCVREKASKSYELKRIDVQGEDARVEKDEEGQSFVFTYSSRVPVNGTFVNVLIPEETKPSEEKPTTETTVIGGTPSTADDANGMFWCGCLLVALAGVLLMTWKRAKHADR